MMPAHQCNVGARRRKAEFPTYRETKCPAGVTGRAFLLSFENQWIVTSQNGMLASFFDSGAVAETPGSNTPASPLVL